MCLLPVGCTEGLTSVENSAIWCSSDDDCLGETVCNEPQARCVPPGSDQDIPALEEVTVVPVALREGTVRVTLRADEALLASATQLEWSLPNVAVTQTTASDTQQTFSIPVDSTLPEGFYALESIRVTDLAGNVGRTVPGVGFSVDRTPPELFNAQLVEPPPNAVFSDLPPNNIVRLRLFPTESLNLERSELIIGSLSSRDPESPSCVTETNGVLVCGVFVPPGIGDQDAVSELRLVDRADNASTLALGTIALDTEPPSLVDNSLTLELERDGTDVDRVNAGVTLSVGFNVTEVLLGQPTVFVEATNRVSLVLLEKTGLRYTFVLPQDSLESVPNGTWPLSIEITDRVGHVRVSAPELPAPFSSGILFEGQTGCPPAPSRGCVDFDGDGFDAVSPQCAGGTDFNDFDPLSYPNALELPGDGVDNDGIAGDEVPDETNGIFVDADNGDDENPGTRELPVRSLDVARDLAGDKKLYLAASTLAYSVAEPGALATGRIFGGFDPGTWEKIPGARSALAVGFTERITIDSLETAANSTLIRAVVYRSRVGSMRFDRSLEDSILALDSTFGRIELPGGPATLRRSRAGSVLVGNLTMDRSIVSNVWIFNGASTLSNSVVDSSDAYALRISGGGTVQIFQSTLLSNNAEVFFFDIVRTETGSPTAPSTHTTVVRGSILARRITGPLVRQNPDAPAFSNEPTLSFFDNLLFNPGGELVASATSPAGDIAEFNGCTWEDCGEASGNIFADPVLDGTFGIGSGSGARDQAIDTVADGAPTSLVQDINGDCRFADGLADLGADEFPTN